MGWEEVDSKWEQRLLTQLKREVGKKHVLYGRIDDLDVIAAATENDDIVVYDRKRKELLGVHPTWSRKKEADPQWPSVWELDEPDLENLPGLHGRRGPNSLLEARK